MSTQVQILIDLIPDDQEDELRTTLSQLLNPWEIELTQGTSFLGDEIVENLHDRGFLPIPEELPPPISLEPDESPLMMLEEWLMERLP
jgi:hypothetical protein